MKNKFALTSTLLFTVFISFAQADICADKKKYSIDLDASSKFVTITPKDFNSEGDPYVTHNIDLNNDGKEDLIVNLKDCSDPTHCKFGVYIQCEDGKYLSVYQPEYWLPSFRISENEKGWKEIVLYERDIEAGKIFVKDTLKYNGKIYSAD
ncbi:hypothetical protein [Abyssalbus ytuae]|uniref:Uncharacterized protein n=1 Tax=Abyssalbus ytuae TaxID=2926907 RepID=A0A9E7D3A6_9FLAO|nr:hypothetical protein [Abyssalbus ytuae]UOB17634.1 hypothetical protein MQE35_18075 [Abyssalbus ytuae]